MVSPLKLALPPLTLAVAALAETDTEFVKPEFVPGVDANVAVTVPVTDTTLPPESTMLNDG
jgi:hypothetical protein